MVSDSTSSFIVQKAAATHVYAVRSVERSEAVAGTSTGPLAAKHRHPDGGSADLVGGELAAPVFSGGLGLALRMQRWIALDN
jgi:hypothetical protein